MVGRVRERWGEMRTGVKRQRELKTDWARCGGTGREGRDRERREGQGEVGSEGQGAVASDSKRWEGLGRGVEGQREVGRDRER